MNNNYYKSNNRPSQLGQDDKCLDFLKGKREGYFVDIGAFDGLDLSNTKKLEYEYGWKGICVEPIKEMYEICKDNRPNSICINKCIYDENTSVNFNIVGKDDYSMLSGISNNGTEIIDAITFTKLLDEADAPKIMDFLSLDTEGSELKILQSLDHSKYKFRFITVEHNYNTDVRKCIRDELLNNGYKFYGVNQWDDMYIRDEQSIY